MALTSRQKKIISVIGLIFVLIVFLGVRFHRAQPEAVSLEVWGIADEPEAFSAIIGNFQSQYPAVNINYSIKDEDTYHQELLEAFSNNQAPDIFMLWNSQIPFYENKVSPLDLSADEDFNLYDVSQSYPQEVKKEILRNDYLLGIPISTDNLALYYNRDIFNYYNIALPPSTWEEVLNLIAQLRRTNSQGQITRAAIALGSSGNIRWSTDILSALMMQYGSNIVNEEREETTFNNPVVLNGSRIFPGQEALSFYSQFSNPRSGYYTWNENFSDSVIAFSQGETAMMIGYQQAKKIIEAYGSDLNYETAALPQWQSSGEYINYGDAVSLVVSRNSAHPRESWLFLKFMAQENVAEFYYTQTQNPPARLDLIQKYVNDPENGIFIRQILTSQNWHQYNFQEIQTILQEMIANVANQGQTVEQAAKTAADRINFFWSKNE